MADPVPSTVLTLTPKDLCPSRPLVGVWILNNLKHDFQSIEVCFMFQLRSLLLSVLLLVTTAATLYFLITRDADTVQRMKRFWLRGQQFWEILRDLDHFKQTITWIPDNPWVTNSMYLLCAPVVSLILSDLGTCWFFEHSLQIPRAMRQMDTRNTWSNIK